MSNTSSSRNGDQESTWTWYPVEHPPELAIVQIIVLLFILVGNLFVLFTFSRMKKLKTQHRLMIGLCVADLVNVVPATAAIGIQINGGVFVNTTLCKILGLVSNCSSHITIHIHSALCADKLVSVKAPIMHRRLTQQRNGNLMVTVLIILCILFSMIFNTVTIFTNFGEVSFKPAIATCHSSFAPSIAYTVIIGVLFGVAPLMLQIIACVLIIRKVKMMDTLRQGRTIKALSTLALTYGLYYLCQAPMGIAAVLLALPTTDPPTIYIFVSQQMFMANSGMSFIIYYFTMQKFKAAFHSLLRRGTRVEAESTL